VGGTKTMGRTWICINRELRLLACYTVAPADNPGRIETFLESGIGQRARRTLQRQFFPLEVSPQFFSERSDNKIVLIPRCHIRVFSHCQHHATKRFITNDPDGARYDRCLGPLHILCAPQYCKKKYKRNAHCTCQDSCHMIALSSSFG